MNKLVRIPSSVICNGNWPKISGTALKVFVTISEFTYGRVDVWEIAQLLEISYSTVYKAFKELRELGLLTEDRDIVPIARCGHKCGCALDCKDCPHRIEG